MIPLSISISINRFSIKMSTKNKTEDECKAKGSSSNKNNPIYLKDKILDGKYKLDLDIKGYCRSISTIRFGSHKDTKKSLAFKILSDGAKELFITQKVQKIPNIIELIDSFDEENFTVMVFPLLDKVDLTKLDLIVIAEYINKLLNVLIELEKLEIMHMDITNNNILLYDGEITLIDFGLAKTYDEKITFSGTLGFLAPELRDKNTVINNKLDVYGLGIVFVIMLQPHIKGCYLDLFRKKHFTQKNVNNAINNIKNFVMRKSSGINPLVFDAAHMLLKMIELDPERRFHPKELLEMELMSAFRDKNRFIGTEYKSR